MKAQEALENLVLLAGVVAAVAFLGAPLRELVIVGLAGLSFVSTDPALRKANRFMVRSIAEERGVKMPSFGGYMLCSCAVLLPVFVLVTLVFFRR